MALAPLLICTHTRLNHLKQVISSIKNSNLSSETVLYISSDAPRNDSESQIVNKVRDFVDSITGFKEVIHIKRETNLGHFENFQLATMQVFNEHNKIIKLEDDIIFGDFCLEYFNYYLDAYENIETVVSISSNIWPKYSNDTEFHVGRPLLLPLMNGWGWATWRDKFYKIDHTNALSKEFVSNPYLFVKMIFTNPSLLGMVNAVSKGRLIAGDVNWALHLIKYNRYVIFPPFAISGNIGFDGSGQNCNADTYSVFSFYSNENFKLINNLNYPSLRIRIRTFFYFGGFSKLIKQLFLFFMEKYFGSKSIQFLIRVKRYIYGYLSF